MSALLLASRKGMIFAFGPDGNGYVAYVYDIYEVYEAYPPGT